MAEKKAPSPPTPRPEVLAFLASIKDDPDDDAPPRPGRRAGRNTATNTTPLAHASCARQLARLGCQLASPTELDLNGNFVEHEGVKALASAPALANLRCLNLNRNMLWRDSVAALAGSPHLRRLRRLNLGSHDLADRLRHLVNAEWMPGLPALNVV
jgi:hypothetical protein